MTKHRRFIVAGIAVSMIAIIASAAFAVTLRLTIPGAAARSYSDSYRNDIIIDEYGSVYNKSTSRRVRVTIPLARRRPADTTNISATVVYTDNNSSSDIICRLYNVTQHLENWRYTSWKYSNEGFDDMELSLNNPYVFTPAHLQCFIPQKQTTHSLIHQIAFSETW
ncbi:MAG: hypothetical protein QNJ97_24820 [Myxococcota bacterium]|nr:hypothetical protein [Myxococcota bacterium]